jgi:hypothetical protein
VIRWPSQDLNFLYIGYFYQGITDQFREVECLLHRDIVNIINDGIAVKVRNLQRSWQEALTSFEDYGDR